MRVNGRNVFEAQAGEAVEVKQPPHVPRLEKGWDIYLASASEVKGAYPYEKPKPGAFRQRRQVDVSVMIEKGKLSAATGEFFLPLPANLQKAENPDKTADAVRKAFGKTGDTDFVLGNLTIENPQGLFAPASLLNELRRGLYGQVVF